MLPGMENLAGAAKETSQSSEAAPIPRDNLRSSTNTQPIPPNVGKDQGVYQDGPSGFTTPFSAETKSHATERGTKVKEAAKQAEPAGTGGSGRSDSEDASTATDATGLPPEGVPLKYYEGLDEEALIVCFDAIDLYFRNLLEEFRSNANEAVKSHAVFGNRYTKWRFILIVATGGLAVVNILAANSQVGLSGALSLVAAVYAAILALLTNLESFFNYGERKTSTRESRELYLDAYRSFEMLWLTYVFPYGKSPFGCFTYAAIYRRLVTKDVELRRKIMQFSQAHPGSGENHAPGRRI